MIQEIQVIKAEKKDGKNGPFISLKTDLGYMSCFNPSLLNQFIQGNKYKVLTEQSGKFTNILGIEQELGLIPANELIAKNQFSENNKEKLASVILSYVKDIVVASMAQGNDKALAMDSVAEVVIRVYNQVRKEI